MYTLRLRFKDVDTLSSTIDLDEINTLPPEKTTVTTLDIGLFLSLGYYFNL